MKKFFYSILAVTTMLLAATSCSNEEDVIEVGYDGKAQKVTFKVELPGETASRAIADGVEVAQANMANKLAWALYETGKEDNLLDTGTATKEKDGKEFTVDIDMVKGLSYKILFLAYNEGGTIFDVTEGDDLKSLNYKSAVVSNAEAYDAFVACHSYNTLGGSSNEVHLKRPFAQINAATTDDDLTKADKLGAVVTNSQLVIEKVPTQYNVLTGEVSEYKDVTYTKNAILKDYQTQKNEILKNVDGANYNYLNMVYVLAGEGTSTSSNHDATFTFYRDEEPQLVRTLDIVNLPIQRNYRTNVVGNLITQTESFKVIIDAEFDGDKNINPDEVEATTTTVATADDLQAAIDAANGPTIIKFEQDINANSTRAASLVSINIVQKEGVDLVIDGCGYKFEGVITVNGNGRSTGKETLAFKNIKFYTESTDGITFINAPSKIGDKYNYSHNVTIEDCTFETTNTHVTGSASFTGTYNFAMKNCTATNMHSILQVQSCDNTAVVDNVKTINCKNGVSFGNTANATITNSTIQSTAYGIRGDGNASRGNLVIKNTTINANVPVVIRKVTTDGYSVTLGENTALTAGQLYAVVFTKGDDGVAFEAPTVIYTINGADDYNVFPMKAGAAVNASTNEQMSSAIEAGATTIKLTEGTYIIPDAAQGKTLTFIGAGKPEDTTIATQDDGSYEGCDYSLDGSTVTFENISINTNSATYTGYARLKATYKNCIINGTYTLYDNSTFEKCTFNVKGDVYNIWTWGAPNATFTDCIFNTSGKAILLYGGNDTKLTVTQCVFNDANDYDDVNNKAAIEVGSDWTTDKKEIVATSCTVNGFDITNKGINTGSTLWGNKNSLSTERLSVTIDDVKVY